MGAATVYNQISYLFFFLQIVFSPNKAAGFVFFITFANEIFQISEINDIKISVR